MLSNSKLFITELILEITYFQYHYKYIFTVKSFRISWSGQEFFGHSTMMNDILNTQRLRGCPILML